MVVATTTHAIVPVAFQVAIRSILHRFAQKMSGFASCFVFSNALTKAFVSRLWITWLKARKNADFADFGSFFVCFLFISPQKYSLRRCVHWCGEYREADAAIMDYLEPVA